MNLNNDMPVLTRGTTSLKNQWRYAYLEAVRAGVVVLCDIQTRKMVVPYR